MRSAPPAQAQEGRSFGICLLVLGAAVLFFSRDIHHRLGDNHDPGPQAFPIALSLCLMAGGAVEILRGWRRRGNPPSAAIAQPSGPPPAQPDEDQLDGARPKSAPRISNAVFVVASLLVYLPAMSWIGFSLSTLLFATGLMWRLGTRVWVSAGMSLLMVAAIHLLFVRLFKVQLPMGVFGLPF